MFKYKIICYNIPIKNSYKQTINMLLLEVVQKRTVFHNFKKTAILLFVIFSFHAFKLTNKI